jgi:hypothetical protein
MPEPVILRQRVEKIRVHVLESCQRARIACQRARMVCLHARMVRLERYMPGANRLTLAITAAILSRHGLLDKR